MSAKVWEMTKSWGRVEWQVLSSAWGISFKIGRGDRFIYCIEANKESQENEEIGEYVPDDKTVEDLGCRGDLKEMEVSNLPDRGKSHGHKNAHCNGEKNRWAQWNLKQRERKYKKVLSTSHRVEQYNNWPWNIH